MPPQLPSNRPADIQHIRKNSQVRPSEHNVSSPFHSGLLCCRDSAQNMANFRSIFSFTSLFRTTSISIPSFRPERKNRKGTRFCFRDFTRREDHPCLISSRNSSSLSRRNYSFHSRLISIIGKRSDEPVSDYSKPSFGIFYQKRQANRWTRSRDRIRRRPPPRHIATRYREAVADTIVIMINEIVKATGKERTVRVLPVATVWPARMTEIVAREAETGPMSQSLRQLSRILHPATS